MAFRMPDELPSVSRNVQTCFDSFQRVCDSLAKADLQISRKLPPGAINDEIGRFRLWCANIGAHKSGRSSLDYRLREASHIRDRLNELLRNLITVLQEVTEITTGVRISWEDLSDSESDMSDDDLDHQQEQPTTELQQLASNIAEINTCLMRLSMAIRNPAPHDQFKDSTEICIAHYESFDIEHVRGKFPGASEYLVVRLGKAISRRRQYLRYREEHRKKLGQGLDVERQEPLEPQEPQEVILKLPIIPTTIAPPTVIESTVASSIPLAVKTSDYVPKLDNNDYYEDTLSQTSYTSSVNDPSKLHPPRLPDEGQDGNPFECPLCFRFTCVRQITAWHKHVYRDLQPYVCTFEGCEIPDCTYESRHEWFNHELKAHRKWWECVDGCNQFFQSQHDFRTHLWRDHSDMISGKRLDNLVQSCERCVAMETETECVLCQQKVSSLTQLRRHLGKHHEELSLFALPSHTKDDNDESDNPDNDDSQSSPESSNQQISTSFLPDVDNQLYSKPKKQDGRNFDLSSLSDEADTLQCDVDDCPEEFTGSSRKESLALHMFVKHKRPVAEDMTAKIARLSLAHRTNTNDSILDPSATKPGTKDSPDEPTVKTRALYGAVSFTLLTTNNPVSNFGKVELLEDGICYTPNDESQIKISFIEVTSCSTNINIDTLAFSGDLYGIEGADSKPDLDNVTIRLYFSEHDDFLAASQHWRKWYEHHRGETTHAAFTDEKVAVEHSAPESSLAMHNDSDKFSEKLTVDLEESKHNELDTNHKDYLDAVTLSQQCNSYHVKASVSDPRYSFHTVVLYVHKSAIFIALDSYTNPQWKVSYNSIQELGMGKIQTTNGKAEVHTIGEVTLIADEEKPTPARAAQLVFTTDSVEEADLLWRDMQTQYREFIANHEVVDVSSEQQVHTPTQTQREHGLPHPMSLPFAPTSTNPPPDVEWRWTLGPDR